MNYSLKTKRTLNWLSVATILSAIALPAFAQSRDLRDQLSAQTGKAELVVPGMDPSEVAEKMKEAISQFGITTSLNYRSLPEENPERPDRPEIQQVFVQGAPVVAYLCSTAYAEITKTPEAVSNAFAFVAERLQICLYSFQKGTKAYLIFTRGKKMNSLTAGLFNGITKAIQGTDGERITKQLQESIAEIKKEIPSVLVERLEVPGMPLQQPDVAAVAALIPAKSSIPKAQASNPATSALVQTAALAPTNPLQAKIEARKSLTAMGMTYHSQEQFFAAVKRKDDVAVQLYLDADNIDLTSKDAAGKTALEVANQVGASDVAALINARMNKTTNLVANTSQAVKVNAIQSAPENSTPAMPSVEENSAEQLPPEMLAEVNAKIDTLDLPPEQKEIMRANAIRQIQAVRALANRMDPKTGVLR